MQTEIQIKDKVKYLGIEYEVVAIDEVSVKLQRTLNGRVVLTIMRGSDRFNAIFKTQSKTPNSLLFQRGELPEVVVEDPKHLILTGITKDKPNYSKQSNPVKDFLDKYAVGTTQLNGASDAKKALAEDLRRDRTGATEFIVTCAIFKNDAVKFDFMTTARAADNGVEASKRKPYYQRELLQLYLASLEDDRDATEAEIESLVRYLPNEFGAEYLTCFCQMAWQGKSLILNTKQMGSILKEYQDSRNTEELQPDLEELE